MANMTSLVDQLADVRAEIRTLKAVENRLREDILSYPGPVLGDRFYAECEVKRLRKFDPKLLPNGIYEDPRFWRTQISRIVRTLPVTPQPTRPSRGARHDMPRGAACTAGQPHPSPATVRHSVPPCPDLEDIGPEVYRMADDFWDRLP